MPRRNNTPNIGVPPGSPIKTADPNPSPNFKVVSTTAVPTPKEQEETGFFGSIFKRLFTEKTPSTEQVGGRRKHRSKKTYKAKKSKKTRKSMSKKARKTTRKH